VRSLDRRKKERSGKEWEQHKKEISSIRAWWSRIESHVCLCMYRDVIWNLSHAHDLIYDKIDVSLTALI
jgi:hypothetical protein